MSDTPDDIQEDDRISAALDALAKALAQAGLAVTGMRIEIQVRSALGPNQYFILVPPSEEDVPSSELEDFDPDEGPMH